MGKWSSVGPGANIRNGSLVNPPSLLEVPMAQRYDIADLLIGGNTINVTATVEDDGSLTIFDRPSARQPMPSTARAGMSRSG